MLSGDEVYVLDEPSRADRAGYGRIRYTAALLLIRLVVSILIAWSTSAFAGTQSDCIEAVLVDIRAGAVLVSSDADAPETEPVFLTGSYRDHDATISHGCGPTYLKTRSVVVDFASLAEANRFFDVERDRLIHKTPGSHDGPFGTPRDTLDEMTKENGIPTLRLFSWKQPGMRFAVMLTHAENNWQVTIGAAEVEPIE